MNNLNKIMQLKGVTALQLAETSGLAVTNIRRIMQDPEATPYHKTAEKLADALGVHVAQIYAEKSFGAGDVELLKERVADAVRAIRDALNDYSDAPAHFHLAIFTHDAGFADLADYWGTVDGDQIIKAQEWWREIEKGPQ